MNLPLPTFHLPQDDLRWTVIHARPRCEKKIEALCRHEGIEIYLPVREKVHVYGARVRRFTMPLFPGYVFGACDFAGRRYLQQNQNVANLIEVADQAGLISTLNSIRLALSVGQVEEVFPFIKKGQVVRITDGPLKGVEGIVERWKDRARVMINVEMIQQSVAVEVEAQHLSAV